MSNTDQASKASNATGTVLTVIETSHRPKVSAFLITVAATIILIAGIKAASSLLAPILLALFMTIILLVPLRWVKLTINELRHLACFWPLH